MKTILSIFIWALFVFIVATLFNIKLNAASDGINTYGLPFAFYDSFNGKCDNCYTQFGFKPIGLIKDLAIYFAIVLLIFRIKRYRQRKEN